jgi:hypothetical protein
MTNTKDTKNTTCTCNCPKGACKCDQTKCQCGCLPKAK